MKYRIIVGDMNSMAQDCRPDDLPAFLENNAPGVHCYTFELPALFVGGKLIPAQDYNNIMRAYAYKTLFFENWTAQDTCSHIQMWDGNKWVDAE